MGGRGRVGLAPFFPRNLLPSPATLPGGLSQERPLGQHLSGDGQHGSEILPGCVAVRSFRVGSVRLLAIDSP